MLGEKYKDTQRRFIDEWVNLLHYKKGMTDSESDFIDSVVKHSTAYAGALGMAAVAADKAPMTLQVIQSVFNGEELESGLITSPLWANFLADTLKKAVARYRDETRYFAKAAQHE